MRGTRTPNSKSQIEITTTKGERIMPFASIEETPAKGDGAQRTARPTQAISDIARDGGSLGAYCGLGLQKPLNEFSQAFGQLRCRIIAKQFLCLRNIRI